MKKASEVLATIYIFIGAIGTIVSTVYLVIYLNLIATQLAAGATGSTTSADTGVFVASFIMFLIFTIYCGIMMVTALLTRKVIKNNVLDKIKPFGILSIIFLNIVGGIFTLVYDSQVKKELERTAPKGKRREAKKPVENEEVKE